ncbi:elongation factor EF-2 [Candidatus Woesearchaeota archaeon]|nr:MAG: elongation factor EF-2 [Candidatus Woesearchaeota archaeon]
MLMAEKMVDKVLRIMKEPKKIRNIGVCAHIDHGKTTFSDNLLAGAGMMSEDLAGKACVLDFHEDEQQRGITIDAASVSMVHDVDGEEYLINLIDTPGHVDFSGDVTRAMRAVDGAIVLIDAVEGIMPQTETVLKQALRERVKPVLFINKVDRLIKELQLSPQGMQERFVKVINDVNRLIKQIAEEQFKDKWAVRVDDGSVSFGSAFHNWALSLDYMQKTGMTFKDIMDFYEKDDVKTLAKKAPLHKVVLNMVVKHHPDPVTAQEYRIPKIWRGDIDSEVGVALKKCDVNGPTAFVVTKIVVDKHAGEVAAGRLFSGKLTQGMEVVTASNGAKHRIQQVSVYNGAKREVVPEATAGNIVGIVGVKNVFSGETVSDREITPFEAIKHIFEPVVTKAIEAKKPSDLPKLIEVLRQVNKEDPTLEVEINEETGEHLLHGMGELHLEVIENRIKSEKGVDVTSSPPIVVFRETVTKKSPGTVEGKSPNKHNKFFFTVEPLEPQFIEAIRAGELPEGRVRKKDEGTVKKLVELGMDMKMARSVKDIFKGNLLIDQTRGVVHIGEVIEMVMDMFEDVMNAGPLAREPCINLKVTLVDVKLHEDSIHRGPGQVYPAVRDAIRGEILLANPVLFEPVQTLMFEAPAEYMGELSKLISNKRGQLLEMNQEGEQVIVKAKLPVAEMFGMTSELRSATGGRGSHFLVDQSFERLPEELQRKFLEQIRSRKGLKVDDSGVAVPA